MTIGRSIPRLDDARLLTGQGRYTDDFNLQEQAFCAFVRASHAHAVINGIDSDEASRIPGVLGIFDARDLARDGIAGMAAGIGQRAIEHPNRDGSTMADMAIPILAIDRMRYVGEPVAIVIADTHETARQATECIDVDATPLACVVDGEAALADNAPELWPEVPGNLVFDYGAGDEAGVDMALHAAADVVSLRLIDNRLAVCFTEPRAALAIYDPGAQRYHLIAGVQSVHGIARAAARALGVDTSAVRVTSPDTGGGFGGRSVPYTEYIAALWAAQKLRRPIKWTGQRDEEFLATTQGRDGVLEGTLGLDADGHILALKVEVISALGARHAGNGPFSTIRNLERMLAGVYDIPAIYLHQRGAFTNTVPISSYRGVGRVEANYLIERLIETAATRLGRDRLELRRINAIAKTALPKVTAMGAHYDSGDYAGNMEIARAAGEWDTFDARRRESAGRGMLRGIALSSYIEGAGGGSGEYAFITLDKDGIAEVGAGCVDQGQGHSTAMRQVAAQILGLEVAAIRFTAPDTASIRDGVGTNASRSMVRAGKAITDAAMALIEQGRATAARLLQAEAADVTYDAGVYGIQGTSRQVTIAEVARSAEGSLFAEVRHEDETVTYPNGCHLCEVEIDKETGVVRIERFVAVDDVGHAVNPMIVRGQSQGGIAQGIGQALMEQVVYDSQSGQLLTGSFMDYAVPRASDLPSLEIIPNDHPCPFTPFGIKGAGEGGTTGAPAAVMNAIVHALQPLGITHVDMPATPQTVWRAIRKATHD